MMLQSGTVFAPMIVAVGWLGPLPRTDNPLHVRVRILYIEYDGGKGWIPYRMTQYICWPIHTQMDDDRSSNTNQ